MTPYLDAGFLLTLLVQTSGSPISNRIVRDAGRSFQLNSLHSLQAENLFSKLRHSQNPRQRAAGNRAIQVWQHYVSEGVLQVTPTNWDSAFQVAISWTSDLTRPPLPLLVLHPALAAVAEATHVLSFDPRSRSVAQAAGLKLQLERL